MTIEQLIELLKSQETFFKSVQYGYIEMASGQLGQHFSFKEKDDLDRFANSKSEDSEQIVVKVFNNKKTLFIATKEYDVIFVYDGRSFSLSQFWKREYQKIEARPVDLEKFKAELLGHFSNVNKQKLSA